MEKYDFTWPGKADAKRIANAPVGVGDSDGLKEHDLYGKIANAIGEQPIDMRKLAHYSAYYSGVRKAVSKVIEYLEKPRTKEDDLYHLAELKLALKDIRSAQLWTDEQQIAFRNHKRDKKGKLISVEAYFCQEKIVREEIQ